VAQTTVERKSVTVVALSLLRVFAERFQNSARPQFIQYVRRSKSGFPQSPQFGGGVQGRRTSNKLPPLETYSGSARSGGPAIEMRPGGL
jgi:hypothetical protein